MNNEFASCGDHAEISMQAQATNQETVGVEGEQDMVQYYEKLYQEAIQQLNRLGTGLERGDAYRNGQAKIAVNP